MPTEFIKTSASFLGRSAPAPTAGDATYWRDRGRKLLAAGDRKKSEQAYLRYLSEPIRVPALQAAAAALAGNDVVRAEKTLRAFITTFRADPVAWRMLGQIALGSDLPGEAERIFNGVLELAPGFQPVRVEFANALLMQGKAEAALAELDRILRREPRHRVCLALKAQALGRVGAFDEAIAIFAQLVEDHPGEPRFWVGYGQMLRTRRRGEEAIAAFRRAVALAPGFGEAWWNLANMKTGTLGAADADAIRAALDDPATSGEDRYHLRFALARALEEGGEYGQAFDEYDRANAARAAMLPPSSLVPARQRVDRALKVYTRSVMEAHRGQGDPSRDPIFILGMPRSGSTLLEQILSAHPQVEGTQELVEIPLMARLLDRSEDGRTSDLYPEIVASLPPERLSALGADYLARARVQRKTDRPFFLDKQPVNWMHLGLIRLILPNAKIIEMRRDPLGCCLSMFRQHFARGAVFTYSIEELAAEYRAYERTMAHFDSVEPGVIKRVTLAGLQADLEGTVRDVLGFIGLPFAPECLRYYESDRAVFTPSSEQVRRPINSEGDTVLKRYMPYIQRLKEALGDLAA